MNARLVLIAVFVVALLAAAWLALRDSYGALPVAARTSAPIVENSHPLAVPAARIGDTSTVALELAVSSATTDDARALTTPATTSVIFGFLRHAPSRETLVDGGVVLTDRLGETRRAMCGPDGAYTFSGLTPGHYSLGSWSPRNGVAHAEVELDASTPERRVDLQLDLPDEVVVRASAPDGKPIGAHIGLKAIATDARPDDWLRDLRFNPVEHYGAGAFRNDHGNDSFPGDELEIGTLALDHAPPVFVSLVIYQHVLATQRVEFGAHEVSFTLDRNSLELQNGSLHVSFVDAQSRARINVQQVEYDGCMSSVLQKQNDVYFASHLEPGWYRIHVIARGYESFHQLVCVKPGADTDLGEVGLEPELTISGVIVDPDGKRVALELLADEYDRDKGVAPSMGALYPIQSQPDGSFRIGGLSRRLYLVRALGGGSWATPSKIIDTSGGSVDNVKLQLARGVPFIVRSSDLSNWRAVRYQIIDESGVSRGISRIYNLEPSRILLAPGRYTIEVRATESAEPKRIPITIASEPVELAIP